MRRGGGGGGEQNKKQISLQCNIMTQHNNMLKNTQYANLEFTQTIPVITCL